MTTPKRPAEDTPAEDVPTRPAPTPSQVSAEDPDESSDATVGRVSAVQVAIDSFNRNNPAQAQED